MKTSKLIGLITIIAATPNIGLIFFFIFLYEPSFLNWIVVEKFLIVITCISGGSLLWRGGVWGYRISIVAWILILFNSLSSVYVAVFNASSEKVQFVLISKDIIISLSGCVILFILISDLIKNRKV